MRHTPPDPASVSSLPKITRPRRARVIATLRRRSSATNPIARASFERTAEKMRAIVADHLPGTDAEIEIEFRYPPMAPAEGNRALLDRLNAVNADLGHEAMAPYPPSRRGAADISFVAPYTRGLAGMGPAGSGSHAEGETVDLRSIPRQAQRTAILLSRLAKEAAAE